MKSFRVLALSLSALIFTFFLTACGGGGSTPPPPPVPLKITTGVLPNGTVNIAYSLFLQGAGGTGTYTWGMAPSSGPLPDGLSINSTNGSITGTPTTLGVYNITPQLTDGAGTVATKDLTLTIQGVMLIKCDACAQGTSNLPAGNPGVPYSQSISAIGGKTPYTWCVLESSGNCDNGSQGGLPPGLTISTDSNSNGVISGSPTTPGTPKPFTVQVRDSETIPSAASTNLSITIFDVGPKSLPNGTLNTPYNQTVSALGGAAPYTVCIVEADGTCDTGTHGALPPGLTLNTCVQSQRPVCSITGTPTQQGTTTFTVKATDGENPQASATTQTTITIGPLATDGTLNGQYAFIESGFKNGTPFFLVGSITLDGQGNVTAGLIDYNDGTGEPNDPNQCSHNPVCPIAQVVQPAGSGYDLNATGDGLGSMTLETNDNGGNRHLYNFRISVSGTGCTADRLRNSCGTFIETDTQTYGSGVIKVQNPANLTIDTFFPGNLAVGVIGYDAGGHRYAAAGAIATNPATKVDIDCNGNGWHLTGCPLDTNDNGNGGSGTTVANPYRGSFSSTLDPTTGRGQFVDMTFLGDPNGYCPGGQGGTVCGFVYYIINFGEMVMMSSDSTTKPANFTLWTMNRQLSNANGWTIQSLKSTSILELTANDGGKADVITGILTNSGNGDATFASDENNGGTLSQQQPSDGTITISSTGNDTGQVQLGAFTQFGSGGAMMYLFNNAAGVAGYVVGTDAKVTAGMMEPQLLTGQGYSNASVSGNYEGATVSPAIAAVTNSVTYLHADGVTSGGGATGTQYASGSGGATGPTPITLTYQVDGTGRGVVKDSQNNTYGYLYVVGPNKFAMIPTTSAPAVNVFITGQPD